MGICISSVPVNWDLGTGFQSLADFESGGALSRRFGPVAGTSSWKGVISSTASTTRERADRRPLSFAAQSPIPEFHLGF